MYCPILLEMTEKEVLLRGLALTNLHAYLLRVLRVDNDQRASTPGTDAAMFHRTYL